VNIFAALNDQRFETGSATCGRSAFGLPAELAELAVIDKMGPDHPGNVALMADTARSTQSSPTAPATKHG